MKNKRIKNLQKISYKTSVEKGFWEEECIQCKGTGKASIIKQYTKKRVGIIEQAIGKCEYCKGKGKQFKDRNNGELISLMHSELSEALEDLRHGRDKHVGEEMADCVLRIMNFCEARNIDLEKEILIKMKKNMKRPYKHGKKF